VKTFKAAILVEQNRPLAVAPVRAPEALAFGQVLVEVIHSGICGAQLNEIDGAKGPDPHLPHLLGHEGVGRVLDVGPGVRAVRPGETVVLHWRPGAGRESETPAYTWDGRRVNAGWVTTFNECAVVSENRVTAIPDDFDLELAPLLGCAVTTAVGVVNNDAALGIGQSIVVLGAGGVGLAVVQAASMASAHPIVAVDLHEAKLEMARRFGATHALRAGRPEETAEAIRAIVGERGADVVVETTGNARVIEQAYELTHPDGRTILVGVPRKGDRASIYTLPLHFRKVLKGSRGGSVDPSVLIPRLVRLWRAGRLRLDGLVTHRFPLDEVNRAIEVVRSGAAGRVLLRMR
jgi:S-(hydroxymethyl)glutathione dehydrogenase/alcohol dehydrogenase